MAYGILQSTSENNFIKRFLILFEKYQTIHNHLRKLNDKKPSNKGRKKNDGTQPSMYQPKIKLVFRPERIWDLKTIETLLTAVFECVEFFSKIPLN